MQIFVGIEVLIAMKWSVFWNITPYTSFKVNKYFRTRSHLHHQGDEKRRWKGRAPLKYRLTFNELHGIVF
jgi:hypothetical protein